MMNRALPAEMESLPHSGRVRRAVEIGRRSRSDPEAARLLRDWREGGFTQRLLAAFACHGSRDGAALVALCADPSRTVARAALGILCDVGDDETLLAALHALPARGAVKALFWSRRRRQGVVDRYVAARAEAGDEAAWPMAALGSDAAVGRHFTAAAERGGAVFWRRLAVLHPLRASTEMKARLDAASAPDGLLFANARAVIGILSKRQPDLALPVAAALRRHVRLALTPLDVLAARRPVAVADLLLGSDEAWWLSFERQAHRLGVARCLALFRRGPHHLGDAAKWLARLPAADRAAAYRELAPAWTAADGVVPAPVLRCLPAPLRADEARRVIGLPALAARPLQRLPYAGLLPWDEAREQVKAWLAHPEAENRAAALAALCEATRFDRTRLGDLLELLAARKHEQDPVRLVFLGALNALPPGRWLADHLPGLARIIRDALDAADLSGGSVAALGRLVFGLLPFHPEWAAGQLAELTRERGFPGWTGRPLTPGEVRRIAPPLTPIIHTWLGREDEGRLVSLASTVGRWLPEWPALVGVLERLIDAAAHQHTSSSAMALLVGHVRAERERVVTAALARDGSWVLQPAVHNYLNARRQDLLTPFLGNRTYSGRFSTGRVRNVLPLASGLHRWTDTQQETFAGSLAEIAKPPARAKDAQVTGDVLHAVRRLSALPAPGPERLATLARDGRPAVREAAVRALGRLDARQGIPELLDALSDDRARFAVYALRQALCDLPPARVLAVIRGVPLGKVTVAKEAIRLAGELGGPAALVWFAELDGQPLHRDVRGALLRALWDHLERPEAWAILDSSTASPDAGVVIGLARIQVGRASEEARGRVAGLLRRLLDHPEPTVRIAVLGRLADQPAPDPRRALLGAALGTLSSAVPDELAAGLRAALASATDADAPAFAAAFTRLLPRRRELAAAVDLFAVQTAALGERLVAVRSAVLAAAEADAAVTALQIRLAAARHNAVGFATWVSGLVGTARWHAGTQTAVLDALAGVGRPAETLEAAEAGWAASPDPAARWMALRLLTRVAAVQGWSAGRRERLRRYQADASVMVADEAGLIFPPEVG